MAADNIQIKGPVSIDSDSKYRVAYDLMQQIAQHEEIDKQSPRRYWLDLYYQCLNVTNHGTPPVDLAERPSKPSHSRY